MTNPVTIFLYIYTYIYIYYEAVSSRQISHHTISHNISLFQIHQKGGAKVAACKFCAPAVVCFEEIM